MSHATPPKKGIECGQVLALMVCHEKWQQLQLARAYPGYALLIPSSWYCCVIIKQRFTLGRVWIYHSSAFPAKVFNGWIWYVLSKKACWRIYDIQIWCWVSNFYHKNPEDLMSNIVLHNNCTTQGIAFQLLGVTTFALDWVNFSCFTA